MSDEQPEISSPQSPIKADAPIDIDLYCLHCGYNLRGLSGDPLRCPECGQLNSRQDLVCPPKLVRGRVRRMEISGLVCFGLLMVVVVSLTAGIALGRPEVICCPVAGAIMAWLIAATEFKNGSLAEPGWRRGLLQNHLYWAAICAPGIAAASVFFALKIPMHLSGVAGGTAAARALVFVCAAALTAVLQSWTFRRLNPGRRTILKRLASAAVVYEMEARRRLAEQAADNGGRD